MPGAGRWIGDGGHPRTATSRAPSPRPSPSGRGRQWGECDVSGDQFDGGRADAFDGVEVRRAGEGGAGGVFAELLFAVGDDGASAFFAERGDGRELLPCGAVDIELCLKRVGERAGLGLGTGDFGAVEGEADGQGQAGEDQEDGQGTALGGVPKFKSHGWN